MHFFHFLILPSPESKDSQPLLSLSGVQVSQPLVKLSTNKIIGDIELDEQCKMAKKSAAMPIFYTWTIKNEKINMNMMHSYLMHSKIEEETLSLPKYICKGPY